MPWGPQAGLPSPRSLLHIPGRPLTVLQDLGPFLSASPCSSFWEVQVREPGWGPQAQAPQAGVLGSPARLSLLLHNLNIWEIIIFLNIPIKLSLIILVTIQIASIRAEIGCGFMAPMNLRVTSVLRQKTLQLLSGSAMNPAAKCPRFLPGGSRQGEVRRDTPLCGPSKAPTAAAGPRPAGRGEGSQLAGRPDVGPRTRTLTQVCAPALLSVCLSVSPFVAGWVV